VIRIDAIWLATEPLDMRAVTDTALARVVKVFGAARPHHAYLFINKAATRIKVLVYDGFGIWLAARRHSFPVHAHLGSPGYRPQEGITWDWYKTSKNSTATPLALAVKSIWEFLPHE
jgi:hypothetical protein